MAEPTAALLAYLDEILAANRRLNLTAIRERDAAVVLHVHDSLAAAGLALDPQHILDLGSGNGFPGVALHSIWPAARVVLLDRTRKKTRAIRAALAAARITGVETMTCDAEQTPALHPEMRAAFDLVAARAVGKPPAVARLAAPLCQRGGHLLLWLDGGADVEQELPAGFTLQQTLPYALPAPAARQRQLALYAIRER